MRQVIEVELNQEYINSKLRDEMIDFARSFGIYTDPFIDIDLLFADDIVDLSILIREEE